MKYKLDWLKDLYNEGEIIDYVFFWGHQPKKDGKMGKSCFSQWWRSDFTNNSGITFSSAEKWMMFKKAELFEDEVTLKKILTLNNPKEIKSLGRRIKGFDQKVWDQRKYAIVLEGSLLKFTQNDVLKDFLVNTSDSVIVEASPYDNIWGIGMKADNENVYNPNCWKGTNFLGFALMEVRDIIQQNQL